MSDLEILDAMDHGEIRIEGFTEDMLQPASVEVRLGNEFAYYLSNLTALDPLNLSEESLNMTTVQGVQGFYLEPRAFVLGHTAETVRLGRQIGARLEGKSTLGRLGLVIHSTAGFIDPGFHGQITLEITNGNDQRDIALRSGMRIGQLAFFMLGPTSKAYGQTELGSHYQGQTGVGLPRSMRP